MHTVLNPGWTIQAGKRILVFCGKRGMTMNQELTTGPIRQSLILFALPLFFSQLFQTLYNTADTVIIGHYLGDQSLAAVGSVAALFELIVGFSTGFGQGFGVVAGQKYGAQDSRGFRKCVALSILLSTVIAVVISAIMCLSMTGVLQLLRTPRDIFTSAYSYIFVISAGLIITIYYNLASGLLRAAGDSKTPLYALILSSGINIVLDIVFITRLQASVAATAWATLIAQLISLVACLGWIFRKKRELIPSVSDFAWDGAMVASLLKMGLSMALMSSIVSIGTLILQTAINPMGTRRITGHTAARKMIAVLDLPVFSLSLALSSFAAQNMGAGKYERVERGIAFANRISILYSIVLSVLTFFAAGAMISLISGSSDPFVMETGRLYLITNVPFFPMLAILLNLRVSMQSMLMTLIPVLSSVIELAGKLLFTWFVVPFAGYWGVCATEPFVWTAMAVFLGSCYLHRSVLTREGIPVHLFR